MNLFVLRDTLPKSLKNRYRPALETIHAALLAKIQGFGEVLLVSEDSYPSAKAFYTHLASAYPGRNILIFDAHGGALCTEDLGSLLAYGQTHRYDVLFPESLPEGLLPSLISADFLPHLLPLIAEDTPPFTSPKDLISWEYQGIDVGVWLSRSRIILERVNFLPRDRNSVAFLQQICSLPNFSIAKAEEAIQGLRSTVFGSPSYCAVEIADGSGFMGLENFQSLMESLDGFAPEAVLSLGIGHSPFGHPQLPRLLASIAPERRVLLESPALALADGGADLEMIVREALQRPNTEVIFDYSPSIKALARALAPEAVRSGASAPEAVRSGASAPEAVRSGASAPEAVRSGASHFWVRFLRSVDTEEQIMPFLKEFSFLGQRAFIAKANSLGDPSRTSVDLSPIRRHGCFCLGRELFINARGEVLFCRQNPNLIFGANEPLPAIWKRRLDLYQRQCAEPSFAACTLCPTCDDWWVFNF